MYTDLVTVQLKRAAKSAFEAASQNQIAKARRAFSEKVDKAVTPAMRAVYDRQAGVEERKAAAAAEAASSGAAFGARVLHSSASVDAATPLSDVLLRWRMVRSHMWAFLRVLLASCVTTEASRRAASQQAVVSDAAARELAHPEQGVGVLHTAGRLSLAQTLKYSMAVQSALLRFLDAELQFCANAIVVRPGGPAAAVEPMEVVPWLFRSLQLMRLLAPTTPLRMHIGRPAFLQLCLRLLVTGSPAIMSMALQLARDSVPVLTVGATNEAVTRVLQEARGADEVPPEFDGPLPRVVMGLLNMVAMVCV